ncbi:MAG TPA: transposase [Thiobacillus sp.]|nr:transposase [Thiobacillus sp.]
MFDFSRLVAALPEGRQAPRHPWHKVFDAVFLGAAMQISSLLQIQAECRSGCLAKRIGKISDDTLGYALQRQSPEPVFALGCQIVRRLKRNGVLRSDWSRGLVVAAVDGIEICSSFARCCDACMQREVQHKVHGELHTDIQYYHRLVAAVIVSTPFPIPLGIRFQKDGEAEVPCALALLRDLVDRLGRRFLDLVVGDAIYLQAPFVKAVEALGLDWAFTLKENQPELLHEAERLTSGPPAAMQSEDPNRELRCWHLPEADWPAGDRRVRVVKTVRTDRKREVTVSQDGDHVKKVKSEVSIESTNFYATNFELGSIPPVFVYRLSRSRWRIDAEVFQTLTTDCHLKHPAVHQSTALVVLTMIRLLAYALSLLFYQRQVRSHARGPCDGFHIFAKRLGYGFLTAPQDSS